MSKQTKPIRKCCEAISACRNSATIGVYSWDIGQSDVNLNAPIAVFCGPHKPRLNRNQLLRNVKLAVNL